MLRKDAGILDLICTSVQGKYHTSAFQMSMQTARLLPQGLLLDPGKPLLVLVGKLLRRVKRKLVTVLPWAQFWYETAIVVPDFKDGPLPE